MAVGALTVNRPCPEGAQGVENAQVQGQHGPGSVVHSVSPRVGKVGKEVNFASRIYLGILHELVR